MTPFNITNPGIGGLDEITSTEEAILLSIATFGSAGQVLTVNGTEDGVEWTAAGSGDVTKVGTPANNQIGVWTGDGTIEGDASLTWDGTSFNIATAKNFQIAGSTILADAAGTTTLSNIDALDATTEATIEAAIDTLANLTSIQGRTVTLADAGANAIFGWDDTAGAYENLSQAEVRTVLGLGTAAYVATDLADLNEATIEGAIDTLANLTSVQGQTISLSAPLTVPADPGADRIFFWDDSETATAWLSLGNSVAITTTTLDTIQDIRTTASPQFAGVNVGDASDTTITRASAGVIAVEGVNVLTTAGGTLTGNITLGENTSIDLDPAGSADGKYSGICITGTAGATLAFGDLIYLAVADSRWELADADALATGGHLIGMCVLAAAADGNATKILLHGNIRADAAFPALTVGAPVYMGETAGDIQTAIPTGADNIIRVVGFALTADELYFCPSPEWQVTVA